MTTKPPLNICLIHGRDDIASSFRAAGHTVLNLRPGTFLFNLPEALSQADFQPDMVVQVEQLGMRTLVSGMDKVDCPKAFWSIDTHLNLYWHRWYGQLFDVVFTTQRAWANRLMRAGVDRVEWLPWFGKRRPFVPHPRRERDIAFVGRVNEHRPVRLWFSAFLEDQYGVKPVDGFTFSQMLDYYSASRLVPNETIFGEVNFRLFEAASCGCTVLNPTISEELSDLFEPGVEIDLFEHVLDLKFLLERHLADPLMSMKMGLAGWERVQRDHLPEHRVARLLEVVPRAKRVGRRGTAARKAFTLGMFSLWEAGRLELDESYLLGLLHEFGNDPEVLAAHLRALAFMGRTTELGELTASIMQLGLFGDLQLSCLSSAVAMRLGQWEMAIIFWFRYVETLDRRAAPRPDTPAQLYRLWARELQRVGETVRVGFVLQERRHLAVTAAECLLTALDADIEELRTYARLSELMADLPGAEPARMGFLSHLSMHEPQNWRYSLELALTHLRAFRLREGLAELFMARDKAAQQGELERLRRILSARDPRGLLVKALDQ